jgi:hypothetical protein
MARQAATKRAQQLHKSLYLLQADGAVVWRDMCRTNRAFYAYIAKLYFWWRDASAVAGYLKSEYTKLNRQVKSRVKHRTKHTPIGIK